MGCRADSDALVAAAPVKAAPVVYSFLQGTATAPDQMIHRAFGGYDDIVVHGATMSPGTGYTNLFATQTGANTYQVAVAPVVVNGVYSASKPTSRSATRTRRV